MEGSEGWCGVKRTSPEQAFERVRKSLVRINRAAAAQLYAMPPPTLTAEEDRVLGETEKNLRESANRFQRMMNDGECDRATRAYCLQIVDERNKKADVIKRARELLTPQRRLALRMAGKGRKAFGIKKGGAA